MGHEANIRRVAARSYRIPTDAPEADGTIAWSATTLVVAEIDAAGETGLGYSYASAAAAEIVNKELAPIVVEQDAFAIPALWLAMVQAVRNIGWRGVCACAISAMDVALWDLKARLLNIPLVDLFGRERREVPIYGSGGFTSYSEARLCEQLSGWVEQEGCHFVKMKVGAAPAQDLARVRSARAAISAAELYVDANGAYRRKQALEFAQQFASLGVTRFEEPVSSDDLEGLRLVRDRAPASIEIAAGEYGYEPFYFRRMLEAGAVDVLQADATRCGGYTGFLKAAALADAWNLPLSAHTAPSLHLPVCCSAPRLRDIEWFYDHVRIERMVFDGVPRPRNGAIAPDPARPGHGLTFKERDAERLAA
ncbi:mandelate racemase [Bradyrhizobium sp. ISRA443]|uniref:enolase C-terminal domain-like protein n=1 Tax=unclassified Bradyrhizobium TaxID=2631580 RepID=UPI00247A9F05|nr:MULTISPECIES: enolase C-terminal domain-like protein [unclassified Bradyrhizobium]WGR93105.1 mandelate racemase [Bradyrhizobium sp. ISRA435]WGR97614.1 mandelate racemase [Bradyrhizobium sp. ISRA436]WGS04504.1 mandelate racemase [Bradyrhizobium sp. ISRA437]WGS11385.1 mandelate racemase [Bradyrhizobium sp. ISRA443]